jgi:hypothetical protein
LPAGAGSPWRRDLLLAAVTAGLLGVALAVLTADLYVGLVFFATETVVLFLLLAVRSTTRWDRRG